MTALHFHVPVASEPRKVEVRLRQATQDSTQFVHLFTTSPDITAEVAEGRNGVWLIRVEGPHFRSKGTAVVTAVGDDGSDIEIQIDLSGKGLLGFAGPLLSLASGRVQGEATEALQTEFGKP